MYKFIKSTTGWIIATIIAVVIANIISFGYETTVGWIDTPNGASQAVRRPYSVLVHGTEGYSITKIDRNGYTNPDKELNDTYVLMMGASHTQGKEVPSNDKYSVLVNDAIKLSDDKLYAYNIACDGHFLPGLLNHFDAAVEEYTGAECITIEIGNTDFTPEELKIADTTKESTANLSAIEMFDSLSTKDKIKNAIKEYVPFISIINSKIETSKNTNAIVEVTEYSDEEYSKVINESLAHIRASYSKPIVFVYHPEIQLNADGSMEIVRSKTIDLFSSACEANNIDFIDTGDRFEKYYNSYHQVPYGFSNTIPGSGHLNRVGHKIMAETIVDYIDKEVK